MEDKYKEHFLSAKQELLKLQKKLEQQKNSYSLLEEKYKKLLIKKFDNSNKPKVDFENKTSINQIKRIYIGFVPLRIILALAVLVFAFVYSMGYIPQNQTLRACITKGLVFPQRGIASISSYFYDRN